MIYTTTKISSLCPPSSQRMQHRLFCLRNVCMVIPPFEAKWSWWSFFLSSITTCSNNIAIHPCPPHPSINQSIHPSYLVNLTWLALIQPPSCITVCCFTNDHITPRQNWSQLRLIPNVGAMISSNILALGKKGCPQQWHHLSRGEELVQVSWELVEFLIAKIVFEVSKLLHPPHAPVFLRHMYRER